MLHDSVGCQSWRWGGGTEFSVPQNPSGPRRPEVHPSDDRGSLSPAREASGFTRQKKKPQKGLTNALTGQGQWLPSSRSPLARTSHMVPLPDCNGVRMSPEETQISARPGNLTVIGLPGRGASGLRRALEGASVEVRREQISGENRGGQKRESGSDVREQGASEVSRR